jgi:hypothetical protein
MIVLLRVCRYLKHFPGKVTEKVWKNGNRESAGRPSMTAAACGCQRFELDLNVPSGGMAMFQLIDAVTDTCVRFGEKYGMWVVAAILGFAVVNIVVRTILKILGRGGPN